MSDNAPLTVGLLRRLAEQVAARGDAVAVRGASETLTYAQLDRRSNQLARVLMDRGVGDDDRVAVSLSRSPDMIVAVLATWKAGAGYVPLDPVYPRDRLAYMLENADPKVVITETALRDALPLSGRTVVGVDADRDAIEAASGAALPQDESQDRLGYIIYTSGSTGKPKGVALGRHALTNLIEWQLRETAVGPGARTLQFSPLSFDVSFQEIFATLASGGELVLISEALRLDATALLRFLDAERIERLFLPFVALSQLAEASAATAAAPTALREVVTAGEQLLATPVLRAFFKRMPAARLHNHYGPSETHVVTAYTLDANPDAWAALPSIGAAITNVTTHILDDSGTPVTAGETGMLFIGGVALARGYFGRDDLTAERFTADPFSNAPGARLYKTGDLARVLPDGNIDFLGRGDDQVKVRGYRIELGEIEVALARHEAVRQAVVVLREDVPGEKRLVGYVLTDAARGSLTSPLRDHLAALLPDYMVPSAFVEMTELPKTPSGKVDRRALPSPTGDRPALAQDYVTPKAGKEAALARIWCEVLRVDRVGALDGFFDLGGNSLLALRVLGRMRADMGVELSPVAIFEHPTVRGLIMHLEGGGGADAVQEAAARVAKKRRDRGAGSADDGIAIIGMALRFPGADSVDGFWRNLVDGVESITRFGEGELDGSLEADLIHDPRYVRARGIIAESDKFDAKFFGINPREAEALDPQQRVFLEVAWSGLEHAGYAPDHTTSPVGVYAGTGNNTYYASRVLTNRKLLDAIGDFNAMVANEKDYVATRVAHKLNLKGPALSIVTACSTSLVAVSEAVEALRLHHCDMALAGGASVTCPPLSGYLHQSGGMLSADGHCRPFDAAAEGTVFSDGAGVVVLKRLADAVADGDRIWAVVRGVGLNNDGADKMSFTAPSVDGQAGAVAAAHADAGVASSTISYVETHGTATPLGDPIEVTALTKAFGATAGEGANGTQCALGSVKSNFGHLTAAAGVAGLIKTVLALDRKIIPPTLHYTTPNPNIRFEGTPFYVNADARPWTVPGGTPRRAGVSSFGVGGTNAHVVVEEAPARAEGVAPTRAKQLVLLSAKSDAALEAATGALADDLTMSKALIADVAFTLQAGRSSFAHRRFTVADSTRRAAELLRSRDMEQVISRVAAAEAPDLVFLLPGQGAQYAGMGRALYAAEPMFRDVVDACAKAAAEIIGRDLRTLLFPEDSKRDEANKLLAETRFTQPAIYTLELALATLVSSWGLRPTALIGHSIGEFVAATLAGVWSPADGVRLVATRGKLMHALPGGAMLSVRAAAADVQGWLLPELSISAVNAPSLCVVGGPVGAVAEFEQKLADRGVISQRLATSHAFHTAMMAPMVDAFRAEVAKVSRGAPAIPMYSTAEPGWLTAERAQDPNYWAEHVQNRVQFSAAVDAVWGEAPSRVMLEVGPRATLTTLARQHMRDRAKQLAVSTMPAKPESQDEVQALLTAVGHLWGAGVAVDWKAMHGKDRRSRVPLPTYPFERKRYWSEPEGGPWMPRSSAGSVDAVTLDAPVQTPVMVPVPQPEVHVVPVSTLAQPVSGPSLASLPPQPTQESPAMSAPITRAAHLIPMLKTMLEDASGLELDSADERTTFIEMGLDSLLMTQVALNLSKKFKVKITFRELLDDFSTLAALSGHLDAKLPPGEWAPAPPVGVVAAAPAPTPAAAPVAAVRAAAPVAYAAPVAAPPPAPHGGAPLPANAAFAQVFAAQLSIIQQQLAMMGAPGVAPTDTVVGLLTPEPSVMPPFAPASTAGAVPAPAAELAVLSAPVAEVAPKKPHGPGARIERTNAHALDPHQRGALDRFIAAYNGRTPKSKAFTTANRAQIADPRAVSGFTPLLKELTYPLVVDRSLGSKLYDIDGNEYVDVTVGFGTNFLGHRPKYIEDAIRAQLEKGYEIGPQHPLTAEVATLIRELTGVDRVAFCNTGSEAVLGALRVARTVTGNDTVVMFNGAYHGIFDEVIVRGTKALKSMPASPGVPQSAVDNTLLLDYDDPRSLDIIRERGADIAAVLVETVQSRRPGLQPNAFLQQLRTITEQCGAALIFDEVITGFRIAPGGSQEHFGIRADLVTYGKIVGGGMPIGILGGKPRFMDALDGGQWRYGDGSFPEVGVTYFAGTFVRHPLTLAAAKAALLHLKEQGPGLQKRVNAMTDRFCADVNREFEARNCPLHVENFGSLWKLKGTDELPFGTLMYHQLRHHGVHIWDARPCFITAVHSEEDVKRITDAFIRAMDELIAARLLPGNPRTGGFVSAAHGGTASGVMTPTTPSWAGQVAQIAQDPPVPGARLGRDPNGNPAWYVPDPARPGKYVKVAEAR